MSRRSQRNTGTTKTDTGASTEAEQSTSTEAAVNTSTAPEKPVDTAAEKETAPKETVAAAPAESSAAKVEQPAPDVEEKSDLIKALDGYVEAMAPAKPQTAQSGVRQQNAYILLL